MNSAAVGFLVVLFGSFFHGSAAMADGFETFVRGLWSQARSRGVSRRIFVSAFKGITPDETVLERDAKQPEFVRPVGQYLASAVSDRRVDDGVKNLAAHDRLLRNIETRYGIDRHVLAAIWGLESSYGRNMGQRNVIRSLATLAYQGRRQKFGRTQLFSALKILQRGDVTPANMVGSWAGAMGHTQFIPTTYSAYAVDYDGDGRRDIWSTLSDALGSTAHYLKKSRWQSGEPWGYEVVLPKSFNYALADLTKLRPLIEWVSHGVKRADGVKFSSWSRPGAIVLPSGAAGPAFVVFQNFRAILRYNSSISYGLAVGLLSNRFRGAGLLRARWPENDRPLTRTQREELQSLLARAGLLKGGQDGRIGPRTRRALRQYQKRVGAVPDGYPSLLILERLRQGG